jgi:hypothetical protein
MTRNHQLNLPDVLLGKNATAAIRASQRPYELDGRLSTSILARGGASGRWLLTLHPELVGFEA